MGAVDEKLDSQDLEWWPQGWGLKVRDDVGSAAQRKPDWPLGRRSSVAEGPGKGSVALPWQGQHPGQTGQSEPWSGERKPRETSGLRRPRGLAPTRPGTGARCAGRCVGL